MTSILSKDHPKRGYVDMIISVLMDAEVPMGSHEIAHEIYKNGGIPSQGETFNIITTVADMLAQGVVDPWVLDQEGTHGVRRLGYRLNVLHKMAAL